MDDVLRYAGKRVIVSGAATGVGAAATALLVELGAEVHALDTRRPGQAGLASFTETDLRDPARVDAADERIGSIVNALFNCATPPDPVDVLAGVRHLTERVVDVMIDGSAIASISLGADTALDDYTATQAAPLAARGIRINCVRTGGDPVEAAAEPAWPLLFLNSPRARAVTGAVLRIGTTR
jgi:NAD(P)-dependent dehydrogenase (short-subunit alcohol dehydrogenase family)